MGCLSFREKGVFAIGREREREKREREKERERKPSTRDGSEVEDGGRETEGGCKIAASEENIRERGREKEMYI